jgi:hypothetical protein
VGFSLLSLTQRSLGVVVPHAKKMLNFQSMKSRLLQLLFFCLPLFSSAQILEIEHPKILVDTIPFRFTSSPDTKNYTRYREIRIGCLNTGKNELVFSGAKQSFTNDTSWLKTADNVKFPASLKPGAYGVISITYSVATPFQRIKIISNSKTGPQIITIIDSYKELIEFKRDMSNYPAKLKEGEVAHFTSSAVNNGNKKVIVDSVAIPDSSLHLLTKLPLTIGAGKNILIALTASTAGKMNFYYGGTPLFFYHQEGGYEDFAKQEFSCIIIPNLILQDRDTFKFDQVKRGTVVSNTFHFTNKGTFTLDATKSKSECVIFDKEKIAPGESFSVTVKFNTTVADSGIITKEFQVLLAPFYYSNSVFLSGKIKGPPADKDQFLLCDEKKKSLGNISSDAKTVKYDFKIKNNTGLPILVSGVKTAENGSYGFCDKKTAIAPGEFFTVTLVINTKQKGYFEKIMTISYLTQDCSNGEYYFVINCNGTIL